MSNIDPASFRDPSGFIFYRDNNLYRQINKYYKETFDQLVKSKFYELLIKKEFLISHEEVDCSLALTNEAYKVIKPDQIKCITYPYEWSFSQLKDAALLTLEIQNLALTHGFSLIDASAYNIQFHKGRPIFIDTLSFEPLQEGHPWTAYRQFCQHFLAPLALMAKTDIFLGQLLKINVEGIPINLASKLLPKTTWINLSLVLHIHMHAIAQSKFSGKKINKESTRKSFNKTSYLALADNLKTAINKLSWSPKGTEWQNYYIDNNNYTDDGRQNKENIVENLVRDIAPKLTWDLGANTGKYSRIASKISDEVYAWDIDPGCVELNYREIKKNGESNILPLLLDLTNPSPSIGWANNERGNLQDRGPVDLILALGLVHHLAIANNLPFDRIAEYLSKLTTHLIIEYIDKNDSQITRLLNARKDIFTRYNQENFESCFSRYFQIVSKHPIEGTLRTIYCMQKIEYLK